MRVPSRTAVVFALATSLAPSCGSSEDSGSGSGGAASGGSAGAGASPSGGQAGADASEPPDAADSGTGGDSSADATDADASLDFDGDGILDSLEIGDNPSIPADTDQDGTPDYQDLDSDADGVWDQEEGTGDLDGDGKGNWRDQDSDGDCRSDAVESKGQHPPVDSDGDGKPDLLDQDSDGDGLSDAAEDANCNGALDTGETDATQGDTDSDGASDIIEKTLGTDPGDASKNPLADGVQVIVVPYQGAPGPQSASLDFSTKLQAVDVYVILDRSGSMLSEISAVKSNLATVVKNLTCPPLGTGAPASCIPDLWAGAGTVGYSASGADTFKNHVDLQPNPSFAGVPTTEPAGCCAEPLNFSLFASVTGLGSASAAGCGLSGVAARGSCAGSPASNAGYSTFGYPCFRATAFPIVVLASDEPPLSPGDTNKCPNWSSVVKPQMLSHAARFVGVLGSGYSAAVSADFATLATDTRSVDSTNGNAPMVFDGANANAATAIENGVKTLTNTVPLDLDVSATDDPSDAVDAVAAFVGHLATEQLGTAQCTSGLTDKDTTGDLVPDTYVSVRAGTPVCWKLVAKQNASVAPKATAQTFKASFTVRGDGIFPLATRQVVFFVPPALL